MLLKDRFGVTIYGPGLMPDRIPGMDIQLSEGDTFDFGGHPVRVMETPGHTNEHIVLYLEAANDGMGACFVGDTIFTMGCGRLFEGTPAQMWESFSKILALPAPTLLYCAHEYTLSNAKFAMSVDGDNADVLAAIERAKAMRERGEPTVPTTVAAERLTNPFWLAGNAEELGRRRKLKDAM